MISYVAGMFRLPQKADWIIVLCVGPKISLSIVFLQSNISHFMSIGKAKEVFLRSVPGALTQPLGRRKQLQWKYINKIFQCNSIRLSDSNWKSQTNRIPCSPNQL